MPRTSNENAKIEKLEVQLREIKNQLKHAQQNAKVSEMQYKKKCQDEFARGVAIMEKWIANRDKAMAKALAAVDKEMYRQAKTEAKVSKGRASAEQNTAKKSATKPTKHRNATTKKTAPKAASAKRGHRPVKQESLHDIEEQTDILQPESIDIA